MMEKIFISVEKSSRMVSLTKKYIGNDLENLQQELVFKFTDEFVNGSARLEYQINNNKYHIPMTKDGETYTVPIKNVLTKEGRIPMQLVIVQVAQDEEIPVFKSNVFDMWCNKSINAQEEAPDDYEYWLDIIEEKLAEMDEALEQVDRLDIDASKTGSVATVSITNKEGVTKTVEITDGVDGAPGQDGEPGPANTLTIGAVTKGEEAEASITGDAPNQTLNLVLPKGDKGDKGDTGNIGPSGNDGFSPVATVSKSGTTATISITDKNGTTRASISDGEEYDDTEIRGLIAEKQDELVSGTNIKTINNTSILGSGNIDIQGGGTDDYSQLNNKPQINSVTLSGNKSLSDLGINIPTKVSELTNDSGYTTNNGTITGITMNGISKGTTGVVDLGTVITEHQDVSDKQNITDNSLTTTNKTIPTAINEVNSIAKGANQALSYSNYQTMIGIFNNLEADAYKTGQNVLIVTLDVPDLWISNVTSVKASYSYVSDAQVISDLQEYGYIRVGYYALSALETQKVDLTNYVTNTDYASINDAGVIKTNPMYGCQTVGGDLMASTYSSQSYSSAPNALIVGKGTLENALSNKGYEANSNKVTSISSSSTDTQYPSAAAVYNYIQSLDASEVSY